MQRLSESFWMAGVSILISGGELDFPPLSQKGAQINTMKMAKPVKIFPAS
jgi:hypothetical protein